MSKNKTSEAVVETATTPEVKVENTEKKTGGAKKAVFEAGTVGVAYIAEKVGVIPFVVREYLRANVRDMESDQKGQTYRFTQEEADKIVEEMKAKGSAPRTRKAKSEKAEGEKKAKKSKKSKETVEVASLEEIEAQIESSDTVVEIESLDEDEISDGAIEEDLDV